MARMEQVSLMELGKMAAEGQVEAEVFAQIAQCEQKMTKGNKPYLDVSFADAEGTMGLKAVSYTHLDVYKRQGRQQKSSREIIPGGRQGARQDEYGAQ